MTSSRRLAWLTLIATTVACKAPEPAIWDSPYTKAEVLAWGGMCGTLSEPPEKYVIRRPGETIRLWTSENDKRIVMCTITWRDDQGVASMYVSVSSPWILGADHDSITPEQMRPFVDLLTSRMTKKAREAVWRTIFADEQGTRFSEDSEWRRFGKMFIDSGRFSTASEGWSIGLLFDRAHSEK